MERVEKMIQRGVALWRGLTAFIQANPAVAAVSVFSVLYSFGALLSGSRLGIDSEGNMTNPDFQMFCWYTVGRYSLIWLKDLLGMRPLNLFAENFLMMTVMAICGVVFSWYFYERSGNSGRMKGFCLAFPLLFLTHPCLMQQFVFTLQAFEVAVCLLAAVTAAWLASRWAFSGGLRRAGLWLSLALMVFSFGGYQAMAAVYLTAALAFYLVSWRFDVGAGGYRKAAFRHAAAFAAGYLLYSLFVKAVLFWYFGPDFQPVYLDNQILWLSFPVSDCIRNVAGYVRDVCLGSSPYYGKWFLFFAVLMALHVGKCVCSGMRKEAWLYAAAALALAASPFFLSLYLGSAVTMRTQLSLPIASAFLGASVLSLLKPRRLPGFLFAVLVGFAGLVQGNISSRAAFTAQKAYEIDCSTALQIDAEARRLGASDRGQHIAMIGQFSPALPESADLRCEVIGASLFGWDAAGPIGVSGRGTDFMQAHGLEYEAATQEEYDMARARSGAMPSWPSAGSVQVMDGVLVVKFSDPPAV